MPVGAIPFPFGICRICKDKATGVHYGVATCEGCKGFFKRSITRGDKYKCFFGGDCDLTPKNRNRCKSCRFKRCLDVGMSVEAVRMGRIPKVDKEKALEVFHRGGSNFSNLEIEVEMTGCGTYDFKINPTEETGNTALQTGTEDRVPEGSLHQGPVLNQSGNSQSAHEKIECDSENHSSMFDHHSVFQDDTSWEMWNTNRQFTAKTFPRALSGFDSNTKVRTISHHRNSSTARSLSRERPSIRSETFSSQQLLNASENEFSDFQRADNSKFYGVRQSSCENFNSTIATCETDNNKNVLSRNLQRWHSFDSPFNYTSVNTLNTASHRIQSSYQTPGYNFQAANADYALQQQSVPNTSGDLVEEVLHQLSSQNRQTSDLTLDLSSHRQEPNRSLQQRLQPDFQEEFQQFIENEMPICKGQVTQCIPSLPKHPEHTFESFSRNFTEIRDSFIDSDVKCEAKEKLMQMTEKHSAEYCLDLSEENCNVKQGNFSGNNESGALEHGSQTRTSNLSPTTQSFENLKFSSPGSVISNEGSKGSGSSQRSGYSPAVIQLLLDQVIELDEGQKLTQKLKQKFKQTKADQAVVQHVLNLVSQATAKARTVESSESKLRLDYLPENKLESMNRFLNDLHNECPLMKKKRAAETQLYDSFENLDGERCLNANARTVVQANNSDVDRMDENKSVPQWQQGLSDPCVQMSSEENVGNQHALAAPVDENFDIPANNVQVHQSMSRNSIVQVPSADISLNQNSHFDPQHVLNSQQSHHHSIAAARNPHAQVLESQNSSEKTESNIVEMFDSKQTDVYDNTVTSTNVSDENPEMVQEMLKTISCMNLGMKILNRFKPEHREKIHLYKQGQLHLRIMTDSDEDCAAIYEKLMQGIPGLNDRILGFCDSVPGFAELPKEDKDKLIKRSYYDMWTLSYAEYFQNGESFWILPTGEIYSAQAMRKILNDEMVDTIMKFAGEFNSLQLTDLETAIFAAVRLTVTVGVDIEDKTTVGNLNAHLLNTLMFKMNRNHPRNHAQLLANVFSLVPLIEAINRIQSQIIANFSVNRFKKKSQ